MKFLPIESKKANAALFALGKESSMLPLVHSSSFVSILDTIGLQC